MNEPIPFIPPQDRPRPSDLADCSISLDWRTITLTVRSKSGQDDAALGRIFMWLWSEVQLARKPH